MTTAEVIRELEELGFYSIAEDVRDGLNPEVILSRIRHCGGWGLEPAEELVASLDES